ncbi:MAG: RagB/SusD family nutrient uptake outer membrane protein, partial [Bacteroidales bacterium]|nr:RagB/SusD family nutrient uptake outer membrane protein [Bacteroidales bacterium]
MNKILKSLYIPIFSFLLFSGCDNFLDKEIQGRSTDGNFFDTRYKLEAALNASYDILQTDLFTECEWRFGEACADDVWGGDESLSSQMGQLVHFRFNTSNKWIRDRYSINYKGIFRVNQVIANAHRVQLAVHDYDSYKNVREILGQAKFLRAFYYFNLVKTYGGVPIRPEVETVDSLVVPRSSAEEVYAYIEKDLREAAIMLPARFSNVNAGKAAGGAAVALLMKVLMYQATPGENSSKWQEMVRLGEFFVDGIALTFGEILGYDAGKEDWEHLRKRLWFKPKNLNTFTDPYETPETELPALKNAYSLEYKDSYETPIGYCEQFFQSGEFCKASVFEVVFKESADGSSGNTNEGGFIYDRLFSSSPAVWAT